MLLPQPLLLAALCLALAALSLPVGVRGDEVAGYNAFNPKSASASTKPQTDPNNFDDVMPATTPGSSSMRAAFAASSNCFKTGGGAVLVKNAFVQLERGVISRLSFTYRARRERHT